MPVSKLEVFAKELGQFFISKIIHDGLDEFLKHVGFFTRLLMFVTLQKTIKQLSKILEFRPAKINTLSCFN